MRATAVAVWIGAALVAGGCGRGPAPGSSELPNPEVVQPPAPTEQVDNPQFANWAKFPPGTVAVHRVETLTEGNDAKTVTVITYTLIEKRLDSLTLESQASTTRYDGLETKNPPNRYAVPRTVPLPPGVKREEFGKPKGTEQGAEELTAAGRAFQTVWYKGKDRNEGGEMFMQTWLSPEAPGGVVRSVTRTPGVRKLSTIELAEINIPE